jgi:hypothetical protein
MGEKLVRWTNDEDQALVDNLSEYILKDGLILNHAMKKVAEDLGRPEKSCHFRWNQSVRPYLPEDDELIQQLKKNNPASRYM